MQDVLLHIGVSLFLTQCVLYKNDTVNVAGLIYTFTIRIYPWLSYPVLDPVYRSVLYEEGSTGWKVPTCTSVLVYMLCLQYSRQGFMIKEKGSMVVNYKSLDYHDVK